MSLYNLLANLKKGTEEYNYGRHIISRWGKLAFDTTSKKEFRILDLGCGHGTDLLNISGAILAGRPEAQIIMEGVECYPEYIKECKAKKIKIHAIDIEKNKLPLKNSSVDLVIANQVLEHMKEIFWIHSEAIRVLKPGGHIIYGVPNLASLHNRLLLLAGRQPSAQQSLSAHVRSFTKHDLIRFCEEGEFVKCIDFAGSNFYPFPPAIAMPLSKIFPSLAWGLFVLLQKKDRSGKFINYLNENVLETNYYKG